MLWQVTRRECEVKHLHSCLSERHYQLRNEHFLRYGKLNLAAPVASN
jgi:hypothetical protein